MTLISPCLSIIYLVLVKFFVRTGRREVITDDDKLLAIASSIFDRLLTHFQKEGA
jgi:hypothetical protein